MNFIMSNLHVHFSLLFCIARLGTSDDLELTWLRNDKEIPENPDFRREREGNSFRLVVAEV
jgi:hypothetical protein